MPKPPRESAAASAVQLRRSLRGDQPDEAPQRDLDPTQRLQIEDQPEHRAHPVTDGGW